MLLIRIGLCSTYNKLVSKIQMCYLQLSNKASLIDSLIAGFYRVNYDNASWYRIIDALKSDSFKKIHVYNRAGIIDDLLNLARTGLLDYRTALDGLQYLQQEKNYLPFKAAFRALDYLTQRFSGEEVNYVLYKVRLLTVQDNL